MHIKTAVILAGGKGTRMRPFLARPINKHLTPIKDRAMINYPVATAIKAGVKRILMMLNGPRPGLILEEVGSEVEGVPILYHYDRQPVKKGPAAHLAALAPLIDPTESFLLLLGDSIYRDPLPLPRNTDPPPHPHSFLWAMPITDNWDDIGKYAQVLLGPTGRVLRIERTSQLWAAHIQTGAWVFHASVIDLVKQMLHGRQSELRITDVVAELVRRRHMHAICIAPQSFIDAGTPEAVKQAENMLQLTPVLT